MTAPAVDTLPDLARFAALLWQPGDVREVRIPKYSRQRTAAGYFDDPGALADAAARWDGRGLVYVTLNPCKPALLARAANRITDDASVTTSDPDILARRWVLVDIDPVRPSGISSSEPEREAALEAARAITTHLGALGWSRPVASMTGNGYGLLYPVDLPNDAASTALVRGFLDYLAARFDSDAVKVDTTVHNASRITAAIGTLKLKGDSTPERPHRRSQLVYVPDDLAPIPVAMIQALVPSVEARPAPGTVRGDGLPAGWVREWLDRAGIVYREMPPDARGTVWYNLETCPAHPDDGSWECGVGESIDGKGAGKCHHNRGTGWDWHRFRDALGLAPATFTLVDSRHDAAASTAGPGPDDSEDERYFLSPAQVYDGAPPVESVVPGIVAHGAVTNLDGKPKAGKTTFAMALVAAGLEPGRRFLGYSVEFDVVIYLTEQGHDSLKEQLAVAGIGRDVVGRVEIVEWGAVHAKGWDETLDMVRRRIERRHEGQRVLLVVDTFSKWARTRDENDATATMDAYRPLLILTQDLRTATLALRHGRKGELEDVTDAARGSNAASGEADIVLHLGRAEGRPGDGRSIRRLRGVGRLAGIPDDLYIELRDGEYVALAEGEEYQASQHRTAVVKALESGGTLTLEELVAATDVARWSVQRAVADLTHPSTATVHRTGAGRKGDPFRYRLSAKNPERGGSAEDASALSADDPTPATHVQFVAGIHAQDAAAGSGLAAASDIPPLTSGEYPRAGAREERAPVVVDCRDYNAHFTRHRRAGPGFVCDACPPAGAAA